MLRSRSLLVPPESQGVRADIVPKNLYREVMASAYMREAQAQAVEHDYRDEALNHRVQAVKESASAFAPPYSQRPELRTPERVVEESELDEYRAARRRFLS